MSQDYIPLPHPHVGIPSALQPADEYRQRAQAVLDQAAGLRNFLVACKNCGLPADDLIQQHETGVQFATAFIDNFFPRP